MQRPVALATCAQMPVEADEAPLVAAFERAGEAIRWEVWDDPEVDWSAYAGVLIRTTWDYTAKIDAFRSWAVEVGEVTSLWNPAPIVRWNSHKRYLLELVARDIAVVPTAFVPVGTEATTDVLPADGGHGYVVKPAEAVGSIGLTRWGTDTAGRHGAVAAIAALHHDGQDVLVQPLVPSVTDRGETSLIYVDGHLSHAVRKVPRAGDIRSQPEYGSTVQRVDATAAHEELARRCLAAAHDIVGLGEPLVYARVDCVDLDGDPCLMELELIEPDLYVGYDADTADRVVGAVRRRLGR